MKNKGFTLVELLGVIVVLGLVAVIVYPRINSVLDKQKQKLHDKQIASIEEASYTWLTDNSGFVPTDGTIYTLNFDELKSGGYVKDKDIIDPLTGEEFTGCVIISWDDAINNYNYKYNDVCN